MSLLFVCDTSADCISKIDPQQFKEVCRIDLKGSDDKRIGPHGICKYKNYIITANSYSNTVSIVNIEGNSGVSHKFIGMHCNDVTVVDRLAFVICGDLNSVVVLDLGNMNVVEVIPCGSQPHSISANRKLLLVANLDNDSISLIDVSHKRSRINIRVGPYPTKAIFTLDGKFVLVCESNMGSDYKGCISIISLKTRSIIHRIAVGCFPTDMYCDEKFLYVSNFGEGTVSIVDINNYIEVKKIIIGGMPRGIVSQGKNLFIGDNYNNMLIKVNYENEYKRKIPIGQEPTGMILV